MSAPPLSSGSRGPTGKTLLLGALLTLGAIASVNSIRQLEIERAAGEVCEAVQAGDYARALSAGPPPDDSSEAGLRAVECHCLALLASADPGTCEQLLQRVLADPATGDWAPRPDLSIHVIQTWRDAGRAQEAAALARRAASRHPDHPDLFYLELLTRGGVEDEESLLRELASRIPSGASAARMRSSLANRYLQRGNPDEALLALGERPKSDDPAWERWFELRGMAFATLGDLNGLRLNYSEWLEAGGDEVELGARYAITVSISGLAIPETTHLELLERALASAASLADPELLEVLTVRLILTLGSAGELERALDVYDRARQHFELAGLDRGELERSATQLALAGATAEERRGTLDFAISDAPPGATLWLSPGAEMAVDTDFEAFPVPPSGRLEVSRQADATPERWVLRSGERVLGSGTVSPRPGRTVRIEVTATAASAAPSPHYPATRTLSRKPADGRTRLILLVLDCADWRVIQYLRTRRELPVLDALLASGHRAVLDSDPPFTAAALENLVYPGSGDASTFVGLVHRFGIELAGLASIGDNPFSSLAWVLPEREDLFAAIGAGEHTAANLLFSHGGIRAGRHEVVYGPWGARRRIPLSKSSRDLNTEERRRWPALASIPLERDALHVRTIAAEFDVAEEIVEAGDVDLLALRIEPLDILTHSLFAAAARDGQDDGGALLFSVYRYIDARIGDVHDRLDADDVLIVMSDHGIRTAMEHAREAFFVASGAGIPHGRAPGTPGLQGVPGVVAGILGVEQDWPRTALAIETSAGGQER